MRVRPHALLTPWLNCVVIILGLMRVLFSLFSEIVVNIILSLLCVLLFFLLFSLIVCKLILCARAFLVLRLRFLRRLVLSASILLFYSLDILTASSLPAPRHVGHILHLK